MDDTSRRMDARDIFIKGKRVLLKVLTEDDVLNSNWYGWFNDEDTTRFTQQHRYPNTKEEQLEYYKKYIRGSKDKVQLGVCDINGDKLLGVISLSNIDMVSRKAEIGIMMGEKEGRNVKCFIEAMNLMLRHAFMSLNLERVYAGTISHEYANLLCRACGFTMEGMLRGDVFKDGVYHNTYLVGQLKSEFLELKIHT
jgi:RimJ/RimL family protein N-acetyltransferase